MVNRWKPKPHEVYFRVQGDARVVSDIWSGGTFDERILNIGNCFETREEAEQWAEKLKSLFTTQYKEKPPIEPCRRNTPPAWCDVGKYVWDINAKQYVKVISIDDNEVSFSDGYYGAVPLDAVEMDYKPVRLRHYNDKEMKALVGRSIENNSRAEFVLGYDKINRHLKTGFANYNASDLIDYTVDGEPCYVLEHQENGKWVE